MNDNTMIKDEVMHLAEQYGFIRFACCGVAVLSIDEEVMKRNGLPSD